MWGRTKTLFPFPEDSHHTSSFGWISGKYLNFPIATNKNTAKTSILQAFYICKMGIRRENELNVHRLFTKFRHRIISRGESISHLCFSNSVSTEGLQFSLSAGTALRTHRKRSSTRLVKELNE